MKFGASRFQKGLRRLPNDVHTLWRALAPRRSDDAAELGDLDRLWRAECEEMDAILGRKDPGRSRKGLASGSSLRDDFRKTRGEFIG
jgi:hypothetical protein